MVSSGPSKTDSSESKIPSNFSSGGSSSPDSANHPSAVVISPFKATNESVASHLEGFTGETDVNSTSHPLKNVAPQWEDVNQSPNDPPIEECSELAPLGVETPSPNVDSPSFEKTNTSTDGGISKDIVPLVAIPLRSNAGSLDTSFDKGSTSTIQPVSGNGLTSFPHKFILDFLYLPPYSHATRLHSLANLASLLYDAEGSIQEASVMKESDAGKEADLQKAMVIRDQPVVFNSDQPFGHVKQEDQVWGLCLTLADKPDDQTSAQQLKQILESLVSQGFEYWLPCLDYVKETLVLQQSNVVTRTQRPNFSVQKLQAEESSLEAQNKSFQHFKERVQDSLSSLDHKLKLLSDERQSLQDRLAAINKEEVSIIQEKSSLQGSVGAEEKKLNEGQTRLATLRQEMFKEMATQQSLMLQREKLCNAWSVIKNLSLAIRQCWNV